MRTLAIKYGSLARIAASQSLAARAVMAGRVCFVVVILGVFTALWRTVARSGMPLAAAPEDLVWYLAVTEWIYLSVPLVQFEMERDIRSGDVAYQIARPVAYPLARFAEAAGGLCCQMPVVAAAAFVSAWLFTGRVPPASTSLAIVPLGLAAGLLLCALHVLVGLLAFWLPDVAPVYWVGQKLLFILGGLLLPLPLYPDWVVRLAYLLPFPWLLWGPAAFVLGAGRAHAAALSTGLILWAAIVTGVTASVYRRARRRLQTNGG